VLTEVLLGEVANPLFLLDEVEKASGDERYPALNALYSLLEERTARNFEDLSAPGIPFDASRVLWAGSSNAAERLEAPIRDRVRIFSIKPPSRDAMRRMITATVDGVLHDLGLSRRHVNLTRSAMIQLAELPPRLMKRTIMEASP
jgi:ATP-dependent Lon protease